jgi:phosphatidylglycerophosphatase A
MNIKKLVLSCFGLGFLPIAPGTWGSMPAVAMFLVLHHFHPEPVICGTVIAVAMIISSVFCLLWAGEAEKLWNEKDPRWIVIDEFAGQCVALLPIAVINRKVLLAAIAAFIFFRIFDVLKPSPIRECELIDGSCGILGDDIVAGLMAGVSLQIIAFLFTFFQ